MIIEFHALQSFGPSNLNRDDTGNPKEALFGGVRRARISSQAGKRPIRISDIFRRELSVDTGIRSKTLVQQVAERLMTDNWPETEARDAAAQVINSVFAAADKKNSHKTNVLVYVSPAELDLMTDYIIAAAQKGQLPDEKAIKNELTKRFKSRALAPDIALFGRMLADNPGVNAEAACQFAHALSTHEVTSTEFDYFTAVDDLQSDDESGAGMLGLLAYNSATYYRHARIHWEQLATNLHGDVDLARRTVVGFMKAFALVVPSGKQNSFVNQHAPDFLLAVVRPDNDGQSLDNAFEKPVRARGGSGYMAPSIEALALYWEQVDKAFRLSDPLLSVMNPRGYPLPSEELLQNLQPNLNAWIARIENHLAAVQA
jgi:CRISPR system Cascade subunit CasC